MIAPSRIGLALVLTLLVPAMLAAAWAWLVHGGVIDRAIDNERAAATHCLDTAERLLSGELASAAQAASFPLTLDAERRIIGPFRGAPPDTDAASAASLAESAANARLAAGDVDGALQFFAHAFERDLLSAEGALAYVTHLRQRDVAAARDLLTTATERFAGTWCGPLSFEWLAAMQAAQLADTDDAAASHDALLHATVSLQPDVVAAAIGAMRTTLPELPHDLPPDGRFAELRAAAAARLALDATIAPASAAPGPDGSVLVPRHASALAVLSPATVDDVLTRTATATAAAHPEHDIALPGIDRSAWHVSLTTTPTSTLLTYTARTCLALAVITLVLGNLLLWRLSRRELALVRMRRDFVDVVSHELRTPLTALSLKAEMLAHGDVPEDRREHYLQALNGDVHRLTDQVERILDFGRLERGAPLQRELVPARDLLARGLRAGRPALRLVAQHLEVEAPRSLPAIDGDVEVLGRALRNLLENAAKYAPAGSTVAVRAHAEGSTVTVEVADTGPGVQADERHTIFQPFVRASAASPGIQGSGLGLALVAAAAKAHGGHVGVRERSGGGAVFTLTLPIAKGQEQAS